jgi:hypothetical protein
VLDRGDAPETIAVVIHDRFHRDRVVTALTDDGIDARAVDRDRPRPGRVAVMTMQPAKGTEFSKVLLATGSASPTDSNVFR